MIQKKTIFILVIISLLIVGCKQKIQAIKNNTLKTITGDYFFDSEALLNNVKVLSSDVFEGRRTGTTGALKAQNYIIDQFKDRNIKPLGTTYKQPFLFKSRGKAYHATNILGTIKGTEATKKYIVISAHYDHEGIKNNEIYNGADDDASGISALFAFAEYFKTHPPKHNIVLAAFDGEELGLQGSKYYVNNTIIPPEQIKLNINMDMISRSDKNELFAVGSRYHKHLNLAINNAGNFGIVKLLIGHDGSDGKDDWTNSSDHAPFYKKKIPFLYFGEEDHEDYHKPTDDFEKIDTEFFKDAVQTIILVFQKLDAMTL